MKQLRLHTKRYSQKALFSLSLAGISTLGVLAAPSAFAQPPIPPADSHALAVILDLSGSMDATVMTDEGCMTTLEAVRLRAKNWVNTKVRDLAPKPTSFSVWKFQHSGYTEVEPFTGNVEQVLAAIDSVESPDGGTPLAYTICEVTDALGEYTNNRLGTARHMFIGTDGLENNTPDHTQCKGQHPNTGTYPNYTEYSWEWKVRNKLISGNPNAGSAPSLAGGLIVDVDFIMGHLQPDDEACVLAGRMNGWSSASSFAASKSFSPNEPNRSFSDHQRSPVFREPRRQVLQLKPFEFKRHIQKIDEWTKAGNRILNTPLTVSHGVNLPNAKVIPAQVPLIDAPSLLYAIQNSGTPQGKQVAAEINSEIERARLYYASLTGSHGGTFNSYTRRDQIVPVSPPMADLAGDSDGDGCVDDDDALLIFEFEGADPDQVPGARRVDFNLDGAVDNDDYLIYLQNYGKGPNC